MNVFIVDDEVLVIENPTYTRAQIRANRQKWIDFLMTKGRKKATGALDEGGGHRCCLGHGCYIMGLKPVKSRMGTISYDGETGIAPPAFMEFVGLHDSTGHVDSGAYINISHKDNDNIYSDLAGINDDTGASPLQIGRYLLSVIEGGEDTPFRPLTDYPE